MMTPLLPPLWFRASLLCALVTLAGCGKGSSSDVKTEQVEGVVTLDGKPVPGATVTFSPVDENQGAPATGVTDDSGRYALTTIAGGRTGKPGAGTAAGEYYVGVVKTEIAGSGVTGTNDPNYGKNLGKYNPRARGSKTDSGVKYVVPEKYKVPKKSGIKVTVESGTNDIPIKLQSK
jgi:hypothetical protein